LLLIKLLALIQQGYFSIVKQFHGTQQISFVKLAKKIMEISYIFFMMVKNNATR